jgi:RNA polymerase sigma-70 factor (ECF subfamily)
MGDLLPNSEHGTTSQLQLLLGRLCAGDDVAFALLLGHFEGRLRGLARRMLRSFPSVQQLEQTDDVLQGALMRMHRALRSVEPIDLGHFLRLAAVQIRRELLTLAHRYRDAARHNRGGPAGDPGDQVSPADQIPESTWDPSELASWTELHERADRLPENERQVFDLIFYHGLTQEEAAEALGVSDRTVRSRWRQARLALIEALGSRLPGL